MKTLNKKAFRQWLESKQPDEIVGQVKSVSYCPIALYMAQSGSRHPLVARRWGGKYLDVPSIWYRVDEDGTFNLPKWASSLAEKVDATAEYLGTPITAGVVLAILNSIEGRKESNDYRGTEKE